MPGKVAPLLGNSDFDDGMGPGFRQDDERTFDGCRFELVRGGDEYHANIAQALVSQTLSKRSTKPKPGECE